MTNLDAGELALAAVAAAGAFHAANVFYAGSQWFIHADRRIADPGAVALTFDDGPHPSFTPAVAQTLAAFNVPAAFFLIGRYVSEQPALTRDLAAAGHVLANHTWDHHRWGVFGSSRYWHEQLARTNDAIAAAAGSPATFFRPPMGFKTWRQAKALKAMNLRVVAWRLRAFDTLPISSTAIARRIGEQARGGDIITLHDGLEPARRSLSQQQTCRALPDIIRRLRDRGLRFVSLAHGLSVPAVPPASTPPGAKA
ncbi:MAG: polysaccharide deacetylase family protein [Phycisphaerales bacterium]|nr:polysaccharide deacetylase family protein [Phycisphaerales bacterium]